MTHTDTSHTDTSHTDTSHTEQREHLDELRSELGATVEELAHRVDVPARARAKRDELVGQAQAKVEQARTVVEEKVVPVVREQAPVVRAKLQAVDPRVAAAVAGAALTGFLLVRRYRKA
ncbi:DUF3618 domain-containing protein [Actinomycetes bacterium KLBMP 9759]